MRFSQCETADLSTPHSSASCSCERFAFSRSAAMRLWIGPFSLARGFFLRFTWDTVDRCSTYVNNELSTDSPMSMQTSVPMGDSRHKKPPPDDDEEDVTPAFRAQVLRALELNAAKNDLSEIAKGAAGYLISNRAELAEEIGTDKTMINKIIGPARETSKVSLVERSAFVGRIRKALSLPEVTKIVVKASRAEILRLIADLPDEEFAVFEQAVADAAARARKKK